MIPMEELYRKEGALFEISRLLDDLTRTTRQRDALLAALSRATGGSERYLRLEYGIDKEPEQWAEDSPR